jgi:hypothetical protein
MATTINERSRLPLTIKFADGDWISTAPNVARYRIDCATTNQVIQDWLDLPPGAQVGVTVTPDQNAIIDDSNRVETKVMAVEANYNMGSQYTDSFTWKVKNLQGFT